MDSLGKTRTHCEFVLPEILELLGIFQRILWISHPPDAGADKLPSLSQKATRDVGEMLAPGEGQYCLS